jgi:hypothetical protein
MVDTCPTCHRPTPMVLRPHRQTPCSKPGCDQPAVTIYIMDGIRRKRDQARCGKHWLSVGVRRRVRLQMIPRPSPATALRVLTDLARSGRILRDPPIGEPAERRRTTWLSAGQGALSLSAPSASASATHSHTWELSDAESTDADFVSNAPSAPPGGRPL